MTAVPLRERVPLGPWGPIGLAVDPMTWRALPYLMAAFPIGAAVSVALALALPVSIIFVVVWVGVPLLIITIMAWRGVAMLERRFVRLALGRHIPDPYRPRPRRGVLNHLLWLFGDPATWRDLAYLLLLVPLGFAEGVVLLCLAPAAVSLLALPILVSLGGDMTITDRLRAHSIPQSLPWMLLGLVMFVLTLYAIRGMAWVHGTVAGMLLSGAEEDRLRSRAEHLRASRARGVDAAEAERRRIERDLHDGAQQRLLSVALDLGRAEAKFTEDPETARQLLASAREGTRAAIAELRDLARGIYPAILTDRGLDAALSALAARAPVRVDVSVEITQRPPPAVESIAYFIVSETLTNIAKHAQATAASVRVSRQYDRVVVEVADNGVGGASAVPGGGLAGLADRAATIDGIVVVDSPPGGPTSIRAELPVTW
jgi:signal transduction histidine kinase